MKGDVLDRWDVAMESVETSRRLIDGLPARILRGATEDRAGHLGYGACRCSGITPTEIVRTIDEARRLLLVAKRELG